MEEAEIIDEKVDNINQTYNSNRTTTNQEQENKKDNEKKNSCKVPTAYTILLIIEIIVFILLYIIPKGKFDTLEYSSNTFTIVSYGMDDVKVKATQEFLDEKGISIPLENFKKGYIKEPIAIPNTYKRIHGETTNVLKLFLYPILGLIESSDISFFLLILGGLLNILVEMDALSAGLIVLSRATKGKEFLFLILTYLIVSIGGTTFGMCEEIMAFYPIVMPIFLKNGLDGILGVSSLYMGSMIGSMFSTINAFSVGLGSYSAGINFVEGLKFRIICFVIGNIITISYLYFYYRRIKSDGKKSICYDIKKDLEDKYLKNEIKEKEDNEKVLIETEENFLAKKQKENEKNDFNFRKKISLIVFCIGFSTMIIGVILFDWWFEHMSAVFFIFSIILIFFLGKGEKKGIDAFMKGAGDFVGLAMIIGIARGINVTLEDGKISDSILHFFIKVISGFPKIIFGVVMFIIFIVLGFLIRSSSGMAVLCMPVFAPLADEVNCSRSVIVNTYVFGLFYGGIVAPTGMILIVLQMIGIEYSYWLKFIWPFMIILFIVLMLLIIINVTLFN